jgi:DNA-binding NarL/FixJ family response regulator
MRVLIVDDDALVRASLKTLLEVDSDVNVIAQGSNGYEAVELYKHHQPDIVLMDIRMDGLNGIDAAQHILKLDADAKILFLTTFYDDEYIVKALHLGSKGFILKQNFDSILSALKSAYMGQHVYGDEIMDKLPLLLKQDLVSSFEGYELNEREIELIKQVAEGHSNKEISERLYLSEGTVRNYISTLLDKLNLRDRTQLAIFYYKHHR